MSLSNPPSYGDNMARKRFQRGSLMLRGKAPRQVWVGRWREDTFDPLTNTTKRINKKEVLGYLQDLPTKRLAERELANRIAHVNAMAYLCGLGIAVVGPVLQKGSEIHHDDKPGFVETGQPLEAASRGD